MALPPSHKLTIFLFLLLVTTTLICRKAEGNQLEACPPSSCGNVKNISYPFRLKTDPQHCGHPDYELECQNNQTLLLPYHSYDYYDYNETYYYQVESIDYSTFSIRLLYHRQDDPCNCIPSSPPFPPFYRFSYKFGPPYESNASRVLFFICETPKAYINATFCTNFSTADSLNCSWPSYGNYLYAVIQQDMTLEDLADGCTVMGTAMVSPEAPFLATNYTSITAAIDAADVLSYGFQASFWRGYCGRCNGNKICILTKDNKIVCIKWKTDYCDLGYAYIGGRTRRTICKLKGFFIDYWPILAIIGLSLVGLRFFLAFLGYICFSIFLLYKLRRRHLSTYETIEDFLQRTNNLTPIRYAYSEIKQITKKFHEKLGEGGYGTVFKGKLRSGIVVAVKVMGKSNASGQEFISEVATIGRIHHVNVVQLIGFCVQGSKRALVYEFMTNGSLEKYIFLEEKSISLSWDQVFQISLGVARGIDYLHRGCDMRILHFDIKPHNILLDENFVPKVSDFGLAKLYRTDDSIVSLTAARGTMGYMAPELFYKNIGGISHKADVYSFGMLLMEMIGKRKNLNPFVDQSSQIYFPSWVYNQYIEGNEIEMGDATENEKKLVMKMIIVALWCIQMRPTNRPSMKNVIDMLEGEVDLLQVPPKPFVSLEELQSDVLIGNADDAEKPLLSREETENL